ncbi:MAG: NAD(P)H-dependent flavin oxidoreductase [Sphingobium sp.]
MAAPMFLVSTVDLVIAQCRGGIIGSMPALNARTTDLLDSWLMRLIEALGDADAPFAINLIVHGSNRRLDADLALCVKHRVPIVITSLGARREVNDAVHSYGGLVFHDVINDRVARKAIEKGADGLIAVAAGAGGHAGTLSPFALVAEIRRWFDGPMALSGSISTGEAIAASRALGADLGYIGTAFIATEEAGADPEYKDMIVRGSAEDIIYSDLFTGVHGNYLRPSIVRAGLDPDALPAREERTLDFGAPGSDAKAWRDIWGSGHGIGAVTDIVPCAALIERLALEYRIAIQRMVDGEQRR